MNFVYLMYSSSLSCFYQRKNQLKEAYSNNLWDGARKTLATLWDGHGAIWHGYEIHGMEKIPNRGPALIVYYHGAIPIDYYYFLAHVIIQKGRTCHSVADHFLFKIPARGQAKTVSRFQSFHLTEQPSHVSPTPLSSSRLTSINWQTLGGLKSSIPTNVSSCY
ncbi:PREDICTED: transmembrane protein 68 isoform X3 [Poecilia mexicana]|uniref:transmembrane protein 68 isoform X3 n=1 Tax=Poecilia mexicana TaxID=48701 RepID=UPI00072EA437|nr:PREDICTED: transmembrane protein 68 isoform X3 [Poecilia mexicana]